MAKIQQNFGKILANFAKSSKKSAKISAIFNENFEIRERCKGVHCVDLGESFRTHIYLQKSASIQPRPSLVKFARSPRTYPPGSSWVHRPKAGCIRSDGRCSGVRWDLGQLGPRFFWQCVRRLFLCDRGAGLPTFLKFLLTPS